MILLFALACLSGAIGAQALAAGPLTDDLVTVRTQTSPETLRAYGRVEPISVIRVRAVEPGTLGGLRVVPGSVVAVSDVLGHLGGPRMQVLSTARQAALRSAQARQAASGRRLAIARRQLATRPGTRQAVGTAQSELAAARAAARTAQAQLQESRALKTLQAPARVQRAVRADIATALRAIPGVRFVQVYGTGDEALWIRPGLGAMQRYGVGIGAILQAVKSQVLLAPAGYLSLGHTDVPIEARNLPVHIAQLGQIPVATPGGLERAAQHQSDPGALPALAQKTACAAGARRSVDRFAGRWCGLIPDVTPSFFHISSTIFEHNHRQGLPTS